MERVLVLGCCGAGKTRLSAHLARRLGLPLIHLDAHYWRPGWSPTPTEEWRREVERLAAGERWVMDGNFKSSLDLRLPRADTVIFLDFGRARCLAGVLRRWVRWYGRVRPDLGEGCPERIDGEFLRYVWSFREVVRPQVLASVATHFRGDPVVLGDPGEVEAFLAGVPAAGP